MGFNQFQGTAQYNDLLDLLHIFHFPLLQTNLPNLLDTDEPIRLMFSDVKVDEISIFIQHSAAGTEDIYVGIGDEEALLYSHEGHNLVRRHLDSHIVSAIIINDQVFRNNALSQNIGDARSTTQENSSVRKRRAANDQADDLPMSDSDAKLLEYYRKMYPVISSSDLDTVKELNACVVERDLIIEELKKAHAQETLMRLQNRKTSLTNVINDITRKFNNRANHTQKKERLRDLLEQDSEVKELSDEELLEKYKSRFSRNIPINELREYEKLNTRLEQVNKEILRPDAQIKRFKHNQRVKTKKGNDPFSSLRYFSAATEEENKELLEKYPSFLICSYKEIEDLKIYDKALREKEQLSKEKSELSQKIKEMALNLGIEKVPRTIRKLSRQSIIDLNTEAQLQQQVQQQRLRDEAQILRMQQQSGLSSTPMTQGTIPLNIPIPQVPTPPVPTSTAPRTIPIPLAPQPPTPNAHPTTHSPLNPNYRTTGSSNRDSEEDEGRM